MKTSGFLTLKARSFKKVDASLSWNHLTFIYGYGYEDVTDGLVAYWKLNEESGTEAYDSSGNNYKGTLTNSPEWSANGGPTTDLLTSGCPCLDFDGADDFINLTSSVSSLRGYFHGNVNYTISFWVKFESGSSGWDGIFHLKQAVITADFL